LKARHAYKLHLKALARVEELQLNLLQFAQQHNALVERVAALEIAEPPQKIAGFTKPKEEKC
jgi:hypothetical protein